MLIMFFVCFDLSTANNSLNGMDAQVNHGIVLVVSYVYIEVLTPCHHYCLANCANLSDNTILFRAQETGDRQVV